MGFSTYKHKSVTRDNDNRDLRLTLKNCSKAALCWQIKDELHGLCAPV